MNASNSTQSPVGGLVGRVLSGRYRVVSIVSSGANTLIADAIDLKNDQPVTVKFVRPEVAESAEFRDDFREAAGAAASLKHPNIATVSDWGEVEGEEASTVFWVVEHLAGGSLRDMLDRGRALTPSQALVVGLEACRALAAAHQAGTVHTELTPSKLVFGVDRRLRIVDFQMARLLGAPVWREPARVSTHVARYASPEQALGLTPDAETDVYALSLSLLESVTGVVPFAADSTVATLSARVGKLLPVSADLGALAAVLERAGRPDPEDRFTASEFGQALVQAAGSLPRPEPVPVLSTGLFDSSELRRPSDPTGGFARPAAGAAVAGVAGAAVVAGSTDAADVAEERGAAGVVDDADVVDVAEEPGAAGVVDDAGAVDGAEEPGAAGAVDDADVVDVAEEPGAAGVAAAGLATAAAAGAARRASDADSGAEIDDGDREALPESGDDANSELPPTAGESESDVGEPVGSSPDDEEVLPTADGSDPDVGEPVESSPDDEEVLPTADDPDSDVGEPVGSSPEDPEAAVPVEPSPSAAEEGAAANGSEVEPEVPVGSSGSEVSDSDLAVEVPGPIEEPADESEEDPSGPSSASAAAVGLGVAAAGAALEAPGADAPTGDSPPPPPHSPPPPPMPPRAGQADPVEPQPDRSSAESPATPDPTTPLLLATAPDVGTEPDSGPGRVATATMPVVDLTITEATPSEIYDDERPRRRVGRILLILVLVLLGIAALSYAGWLLLRTQSHEVPQLIGASESVALEEVEGNEWVILTERERDDDFPEPDTIIRTIPVAGELLDEGDSFTLVISDGPEFRTLPEFVDLRLEEAQAILAELGLIGVEAPERAFSETVPDGSVISWAVEGSGGLVAGAKILPGETVVLTVSKGPEPRLVPALAGMNVEQAAAAVGDLRLELAQGDELFSDDVEAGLVVTQSPPASQLVERGSTITVQISKGPDVVAFPAIVDRPYAEAEKLLIDTGFTIGSVLGTTEGTVISASINGSSAAEGDIHRRGTPVDIVSL